MNSMYFYVLFALFLQYHYTAVEVGHKLLGSGANTSKSMYLSLESPSFKLLHPLCPL